MTKNNLILLLLTMMACVVLSGCAPPRGYTEVEGKWCYMLLGGLGDKPYPKPLHADDASFQVYSKTGYAKDKDRVFYEGDEIASADAATFRVLDDQYGIDKNKAYFRDAIIQKADPKTFQTLGYPYGKDKTRAFCGTLPMAVDDIESFKVIETSQDARMAVAGSDVLGLLDNYHQQLDPELMIAYSVNCRAIAKGQEFRGPILVSDIKEEKK